MVRFSMAMLHYIAKAKDDEGSLWCWFFSGGHKFQKYEHGGKQWLDSRNAIPGSQWISMVGKLHLLKLDRRSLTAGFQGKRSFPFGAR